MARRSSNRRTAKRQSRSKARMNRQQRGGTNGLVNLIEDKILEFINVKNNAANLVIMQNSEEFRRRFVSKPFTSFVRQKSKEIAELIYLHFQSNKQQYHENFEELDNNETMYYTIVQCLAMIEDKAFQ